MTTKSALLFGEPLLLFALGAAAVHFPVAQIIFEEQSATGTFAAARFMDRRPTAGERALDDIFTFLAPVLTLKRLFAVGTFFFHQSAP